jgi:type II secretory ATPase GspE/PulE/Tfp pilus assembly ATPase PilB-like protein
LHLGELMLQRGLVSKQDLVSALVVVSQVPYFDCTAAEIEPEILELIPAAMARRCRALPIALESTGLVVAMAEPQNLQHIDELRFKTGKAIVPRLAFRAEINAALTKYYGREEQLDSPPPSDAENKEDRGIEFISSSEQRRNASSGSRCDSPLVTCASAHRRSSKYVSIAFP